MNVLGLFLFEIGKYSLVLNIDGSYFFALACGFFELIYLYFSLIHLQSL